METPNTLLEKIYGYSAFREGQLDIINSVLAGQKTLGIMPTGGGKSITYQISGLLLPGITLVISPLISLIQNQVDELISARVTATELTSALSPEEQEKRKQEIYRGLYKFVFIAPERLENEYFYSFLSQLNLSLVVIDEAHSLSQWGHDFRPAYLNSVNYIQNLPQHPRVLALTATATKRVEEEIVDLLEIQKVVKTSPYRPNLVLKMEHGLSKKQKLDFILRYVKAHANEVGIIYASKRAEVEEITEFLVANNINARRYHAGLSDQERTEAQHAFLYDEADVIVATVAFGMGINKSNVRYVIHNNMPGTIEAYYQEIGRAGRDGLDSEVTLLYSTSDADTQRFFIDHSENQSPEFRDVQLNKLQEMIRYGSTQMCLQRYIMRYFGEDIENCGRCTNCLDARPAVDETKLAESIIGAVLEVTELGRTASKTTLIDILRGTLNENMSWTNFTELSSYGKLSKTSKKPPSDFIDFLVAEEYLEVQGEFRSLSVTEFGQKVLDGDELVFYRKPKNLSKSKDLSTTGSPATGGALFEMLRTKRAEIAKEIGRPAFMVFSDKVLSNIAEAMPINEEQMLEVSGVGQVKFDQFGEEFLEVINQFLGEKENE